METLGKYHLLRRIAVGGMAEIFLAEQPGFGGDSRRVAIKRILPHRSDDSEFVEMFLNEARIATLLNHPNIVQIYDMGEVNGTYFIAMEYVEGYDLGQILDRAVEIGVLPDPIFLSKILAKAAAGLGYAHSYCDPNSGRHLGLIHRDISLPNIMVSLNGTVKVLDFGIAKAVGAENQNNPTQTGVLKGKISYMSPEYLMGRPIDWRHDLFALGVVMYELMTGQKPFRAKGDVQMLQAILTQEPQPPQSLVPSLPPGLVDIIMRLLDKEPDNRYQRGEDVEYELERFATQHRGRSISQDELARHVQDLFAGAAVSEAQQAELSSFSITGLGNSNEPAHKPAASLPGLQPQNADLIAQLSPNSKPWEETRALDAAELLGHKPSYQQDVHHPAPTPTAMLSLEKLHGAQDTVDGGEGVLMETQEPSFPDLSGDITPPVSGEIGLPQSNETMPHEHDLASEVTKTPEDLQKELQADEEEEEDSWVEILIWIVLAALVLGGGYYAYTKFFKGGGDELLVGKLEDKKQKATPRSRKRFLSKIKTKGPKRSRVRASAPRDPKLKRRPPAKRRDNGNAGNTTFAKGVLPPELSSTSESEAAQVILKSIPRCVVYMRMEKSQKGWHKLGTTPLRTHLPQGIYKMRLRRSKPAIDLPVTVISRKGQQLNLMYRVRLGRLVVRVYPWKAKVYVDGNYLGMGSQQSVDLYAGWHLVKVINEKRSKKPIYKRVYIRAKATRKIRIAIP